jgi:hypothetical protein
MSQYLRSSAAVYPQSNDRAQNSPTARRCTMILGITTSTFTTFHVLISLVPIASGFVIMNGFLSSKMLNRSTMLFLVTTAGTSLTGFAFPNKHVTPGIVIGVLGGGTDNCPSGSLWAALERSVAPSSGALVGHCPLPSTSSYSSCNRLRKFPGCMRLPQPMNHASRLFSWQC